MINDIQVTKVSGCNDILVRIFALGERKFTSTTIQKYYLQFKELVKNHKKDLDLSDLENFIFTEASEITSIEAEHFFNSVGRENMQLIQQGESCGWHEVDQDSLPIKENLSFDYMWQKVF